MKNGIIYEPVNKAVNHLRLFSLVELFKFLGIFLGTRMGSKKNRTTYARISVDIFIATKFVLLFSLIAFHCNGLFWTIAVWYLLFMNIYTYFYYHLWSEKVLKDRRFSIDRVKRRFLNLMLAILFSVLGFAYLYLHPYSSAFEWKLGQPKLLDSILYSVSNSLTAGFDQVQPLTSTGYIVSTAQLLMMFFFLTIIISNSIPQINSSFKEK